MRIEHHLGLSAVVSGVLYLVFKSWELSLTSLITGIFIDIDHMIDYLMAHGLTIRLKEFLEFFYKERHRKITLFLHGWEWLLLLIIAAMLSDLNPWVTGFLIGYGHHIISDYFYSKANLRTYSLIWRWKNNFDSHILFPRNRGYNP